MYRRPTTVWRNELWKTLWGIGIRGKMCRMVKNMTEYARSAVMLDGEVSNYSVSNFARSRTGMHARSLDSFKVYLNDMIVTVEAATQESTVREDTVSVLMFADDSWEYQKPPKDCRTT